MEKQTQEKKLLFRIRALAAFYIFALFFWGVTAFPIETEIRIVCQIFGISNDVSPETYDGFQLWIATVADSIINTNANYPFLAYGTDWLAFSHLVIAVAFIGLYRKPIRNKWIVYFGMIACVGVVPMAFICGAVREIPLFWRFIDSSFCLLGMIPLILLHIYINRLEKVVGYVPSKYE